MRSSGAGVLFDLPGAINISLLRSLTIKCIEVIGTGRRTNNKIGNRTRCLDSIARGIAR